MRWCRLGLLPVGFLVCFLICFLVAAGGPPRGNPPLPPPSDLADDGRPLPTPTEFASLAHTDVVAALEACILRYQREVTGYTASLHKHERIDGHENAPEAIDVAFREKPFAVWLGWCSGNWKVEQSLYVAGANGERVLVRPSRMARLVVRKDVLELPLSDPQLRQSGRYPLPEFGLQKGIERTWRAWHKAQQAGRLFVEYEGVRAVPEVGGRECHVWHRTCRPPEEEGLTDLHIAVDAETWLQVGADLRDGQGRLIGSYHFREVRLNPSFPDGQFTRFPRPKPDCPPANP